MAKRLLAGYRAALTALESAQDLSRLAPEHITLREAAQARLDARGSLLRAQRRYRRHVEEHACRIVIVKLTATLDGISGEIVVLIHEELLKQE